MTESDTEGPRILHQEIIHPFPIRLRNEIDDWGAKRSWMIRALFLGILGYVAGRHFADPDYNNILLFGAINLGVHELGHVVIFFNEWLHFAAGTAFQLAAPFVGAGMFFRQRDYYGIGVAGVWLATSMYYTAWYMACAGTYRMKENFQLVSPFGKARHDWNYLFSHLPGSMNLIPKARAIGGAVRWGAHIVMVLSLVYTAWVVWRVFRARQAGSRA